MDDTTKVSGTGCVLAMVRKIIDKESQIMIVVELRQRSDSRVVINRAPLRLTII